jgi:hypothetical protein
MDRGDVSVYVKECRLNMRGRKTTERVGRKLLLDALKFVGISGRDRVPNYRGVFQLGPNIKYSAYKQSKKENLKVMERIRHIRFMHLENMKSI